MVSRPPTGLDYDSRGSLHDPTGLHYGARMMSRSSHRAALRRQNKLEIIPQGCIMGARVVLDHPSGLLCGARMVSRSSREAAIQLQKSIYIIQQAALWRYMVSRSPHRAAGNGPKAVSRSPHRAMLCSPVHLFVRLID